ncbi:MAG: hypothetical protein PHU85_14090, partial [Phycisphaerae bacterium]|nr:hypothetical protein [Phycisphaerae bacterium]
RAGYDRVLRMMGLGADDRWVYCPGPRTDVSHWLRQFPTAERPTALLANDMFWAILMPQLLSANVKVPEQLSVVMIGAAEYGDHLLGHDIFHRRRQAVRAGNSVGDEPLSRALLSRMPTVTYLPVADLAEAAVDEVVRRISDPAADPIHRQFTPELIPGDTTAPPPL